MSDDDLIVVRHFLLKGTPWDLSRPRFIDFQREQIRKKADADPTFASRLRQVALEALQLDEADRICRGLTALAIVGTGEDRLVIERLRSHSDLTVARYAATCLFELREK